MFVKPGPHPTEEGTLLKVRHPGPITRRHIPDEGEEVPRTAYWLRRLRDGDVLLADPPKPQKADEDGSA